LPALGPEGVQLVAPTGPVLMTGQVVVV